jgi:cupin 2 domain-containing protein
MPAMKTPVFPSGNLFADLPDEADAERFETLLETPGVRIERIVSTGQTTPAETWFDQDWDEWVLLVQGAAELLIEGEPAPRRLRRGDHLLIPARTRHRVTWTPPGQPTVWLAAHLRFDRG